MTNLFKVFPRDISKTQTIDTGMAMTLILLLIGFFTKNTIYYQIAIPVLVVNMIFPKVFYPIAIIWLGLSHLLGSVMSKVILSIVFIILVVPVGVLRQLFGKDALQIKAWKKSSHSVMKIRDKSFLPKDLEQPY